MSDLVVGDELFTRTFTVDRALLVRYAGASGDFNPIHYNERVAREVGLDGVIAHGMATMGLAAAAVTEWAGDPGAVLDYGVRFTRPIVVPDPGEVELEVTGKVGALDPEAGTVRVDLTARAAGVTVLAKAQALVRTR
ncbi:acyl dehydratase [Georgenia sp. 311]|uniref:Acyl dehydratase n=1 Tax=Georgenia wutianyii TaxID=2585135 RepID=A0ABX5VTK4_9MICO|nr:MULTISPECIES: MaoC family dehydratase [Georgenia]QDB80275.1 acyl dehydratase [Georgenia wutianyii]TNC19016.1 acyl dehydratase [Georgenia sp. 311]